MLKRYMHKRERHFAMLNDNRTVQPFEWGAEFVTDHLNGDDPRNVLAAFSKTVVANSDEYFARPDGIEFRLENRLFPSAASLNAEDLKKPVEQIEIPVLNWKSAVETVSAENNTAYATYFRTRTNGPPLSSCRIGMQKRAHISTSQNTSTRSASRTAADAAVSRRTHAA